MQNAEVIDADSIARQLSKKGEEYYKKIVSNFGKEILLADSQEIDRKKLAKIVFENREKKEKLDKLTLNYVVPEIKNQAKKIAKTKQAIIDAPLLFETNLDSFCDMTIGITAKEETCLDRICKRDNVEEQDAKARLNNQHEIQYFKEKCNYVINNEDEDDIEKQIKEIFSGENLSNNNMIHCYNGEIEYLQFRRLLRYADKIEHCYTLKPLDFNITKTRNALEDYNKICKVLNLDIEKIYRPKQTHSINIKKIENEPYGIYKIEDTDGLVTNKKQKILSLTYADCTPLYFYDPVKNTIGNIHSGWKGTLGEIAKYAVEKLVKEFNVNPENLICRNRTKYKKLLF